MIQDDPLTSIYIGRFGEALKRYGVPERGEIAADVKSHIAEAVACGKPLADVIAALGPADTLARAYAVELLMEAPKDAQPSAAARWLKIVSLVIAAGFLGVTFMLPIGLLGVALLVSAPLFVIGGGLAAIDIHPWWINTGNLPSVVVVALGPAAFAIGWGCCWLFWRYVRVAARTLRKSIPLASITRP